MAFDQHTYQLTKNLSGGPIIGARLENDVHAIPLETGEDEDRGRLLPRILSLIFLAAIASWILFF